MKKMLKEKLHRFYILILMLFVTNLLFSCDNQYNNDADVEYYNNWIENTTIQKIINETEIDYITTSDKKDFNWYIPKKDFNFKIKINDYVKIYLDNTGEYNGKVELIK